MQFEGLLSHFDAIFLAFPFLCRELVARNLHDSVGSTGLLVVVGGMLGPIAVPVLQQLQHFIRAPDSIMIMLHVPTAVHIYYGILFHGKFLARTIRIGRI